MKTQVKLAAELGSKIYRFNYNPVTEGKDFAYSDTVLAEALAYGMDMMLVLDDAQGNAGGDCAADRRHGGPLHGLEPP